MASICNYSAEEKEFIEKRTTGVNCSTCIQLQINAECLRNTLPAALLVLCLTTYILILVLVYEVTICRGGKTKAVNKLYVISVVLTTCTAAVNFVNSSGLVSPNSCKYLNVYLCSSFPICSLTVYTILWFRQRRFYFDPLFVDSQSKCSNFVSRFVIVGLYCSVIGVSVIFNRGTCTVGFENHCLVNFFQPIAVEYAIASTVSVVALGLFFKTILLYLTIRPLVNNGKIDFRLCWSNFLTNTEKDIRNLIARLALCMFISFLASTLAGLMILFIFFKRICFAWDVIGDLELCISNVAVICSFADGLERLCPVLVFRGTSAKRRPRY